MPETIEPIAQGEPRLPSDADLMERVRGGDRDAFADLVDCHKDAVVNYLTRLTGDRDRAVPVGVGLDHGQHAPVGAGETRGEAQVAAEGVEIDPGERRPPRIVRPLASRAHSR